MNFQELQLKIDHARKLSHNFLPDISMANFRELINTYKNHKAPFLTHIDENNRRTELTYQDFCHHVFGAARFMQKHGLTHGDRVATVSHNHWQTVVQYYAAWLLGLVIVPINPDENDEQIASILENSNVEMIFVRVDYRKKIKNVLEKYDVLKHIEAILCEDTLANYAIYDDQLSLPDEPLAEAEALIIFKPTLWGSPKGVVLSQQNLLEDARAMKQWHHIDEYTRIMGVSPIHCVNGIVLSLVTPFFACGTAILHSDLQAAQFFSIIEKEQIHIVNLEPSLLQQLNKHYKNKKRSETASLRHVICGTEPLNVRAIETFEDQQNVRVINGYGMPETTCYSCCIPLDIEDESHKKWRTEYEYPSVGVDISANEVEIHDKQGNSLQEEERGEVVIRGVNVMMGYYNDKKANEEAFKNGWFRTGDEGFFVRGDIDRKFFFITGKVD